MKLGETYFEEDNVAPLYGSTEHIERGRLRAVYVADNRPWWIEITAPPGSPRDAVFQNWMMLCTWLRRAAPILDGEFSNLPMRSIAFLVSFAEVRGTTTRVSQPKGEEELRLLVRVSCPAGGPEVVIKVEEGFEDGLARPDNIAERILVEGLVLGAATAGGEIGDADKQHRLVSSIVPNLDARHLHRIHAQHFRDLLRAKIDSKPLLVDQVDQAACVVGLGWRARSRSESPEVTGVSECTAYLNNVVGVLLDDICHSLRSYDRLAFVIALLHVHEAAARDRDVWRRTARASLAIHYDTAAALNTIVEHDNQLGICFTTTRILLEAALCECPLEGGLVPGQLDTSRLMSQALSTFTYGGWSDAVYWRAMEAHVKITPLGDVHMSHSFLDGVYEPFARLGGETQVRSAADRYAKIYDLPRRSSLAEIFEERFLEAWHAEFGVSLEGLQAFVDRVEELGLKQGDVIVISPRSEFVSILAGTESCSPDNAAKTLALLTTTPRAKWRVSPEGFRNSDWHPWRFRRRLSITRRPLIQLDSTADPKILLAPGLLREALRSVLIWFYRGEVHSAQAGSPEMESWIGHANSEQRLAFNAEVAARMRELGWEADQEVTLTKLLRKRHDPKHGDLRKYGDVDVLAWRKGCGRVLAIECKDLQYQKTLGDVAAQLAEFRGDVHANGKPDLLKKHLSRIEVLRANADAIAKELGLTAPIEIEGHLVFKNPVPMRFAWERMSSRIRLSLFGELDRL